MVLCKVTSNEEKNIANFLSFLLLLLFYLYFEKSSEASLLLVFRCCLPCFSFFVRIYAQRGY